MKEWILDPALDGMIGMGYSCRSQMKTDTFNQPRCFPWVEFHPIIFFKLCDLWSHFLLTGVDFWILGPRSSRSLIQNFGFEIRKNVDCHRSKSPKRTRTLEVFYSKFLKHQSWNTEPYPDDDDDDINPATTSTNSPSFLSDAAILDLRPGRQWAQAHTAKRLTADSKISARSVGCCQ